MPGLCQSSDMHGPKRLVPDSVRLASGISPCLEHAGLRMTNDHAVETRPFKPIWQPLDTMPTLPQGLEHLGGDAPFSAHHSRQIAGGRAGAREIIGVKARFFDRFLPIKPELHGVEEDLQRPLRNVIAPVAAQCHHRLAILEHQRWRWGEPWALTWSQSCRMPGLELGLGTAQGEGKP